MILILDTCVADPGFGAFLTPGSGSVTNDHDHISERLKKNFGVDRLKFSVADPDPGSGMEESQHQDPG